MTKLNDKVGELVWPFKRSCPMLPPPGLNDARDRGRVVDVRMWDGAKARLIPRYADIKELFGRPDLLSSDTSRPGFPQSTKELSALRGRQRAFVRMDPPEHDTDRRLVAQDFTVKRAQALRPQLDKLVAVALDEMEKSGGPVDLVRALALPVPAKVVIELMDLPESDADFFIETVTDWISLDSSHAVGLSAAERIHQYFDRLIDVRIEHPGSDLVSRLVHEEFIPGNVSREKLLHLLHLLVVGGFDTTANTISLGALAFMQNPEQLEILLNEPEALPSAVEELLRYLSVAHHTATRQATQDFDFHGCPVNAGDGVLLPTMAANHDPEVFSEPHIFDIRRDARKHLAFGFGIHQCIGQAYARVELAAVFSQLFQRFPRLRLAGDFNDLHFNNAIIYGVEELPVIWD